MGIDFGTTRTVVACVDRGNYPVVGFFDPDGDSHEYFPSVAALTDDGLVFGFEALDAGARGAPLVRSFKRALSAPSVTGDTLVHVGGQLIPLPELLAGYFTALRGALLTSSSVSEEEELGPVVVATPAHAHGAQRMMTLDAFHAAGFVVAKMINEPSAAGFEYTHRQGRTVSSRRTQVLVYDLGGGTFDASLVSAEGTDHEVLGTVGVNLLGGDDFDEALMSTVLDHARLTLDDLSPAERYLLLDECRDAKESLTPQTRRLAIEVGGRMVTIPVETYYDAAAELVRSSIEAMTPLVTNMENMADLTNVAGIYLVGGGSALPLVPRLLRQEFGRRVHRSPYPAASTAIGLAIAADTGADYSLTERVSRGFGVFRESEGGAKVSFDPIFSPDDVLSTTDGLTVTRRYQSAHNIGVFRFVEYSALHDDGYPKGDIVPYASTVFPFDPALQDGRDLSDEDVERIDVSAEIEERYRVDPNGVLGVEIEDLITGYSIGSQFAAQE